MAIQMKDEHDIVTQWHIRPATETDIPAIVELENTCCRAITGEDCTTVDQTRMLFERPDFNVAADSWLAFTPEGELIAFAGLIDRAPHVALWSWVDVHPDYEATNVGSVLTPLVEARAREIIPHAPEGTRVVLLRGIQQEEAAARHLLEQHAYTVVRHSWRMRIELGELPPAPVFPPEVRMRTIDPDQDVVTIYRTIDESFQDHWGHVAEPEESGIARLKKRMTTDPNFDPTLWFLAISDTPEGEEVAAVLMCDGKMPGDPDMAYIAVLGVRRPWRRKGIGLALLHYAFNEFYRRGIARASLHVDAGSLTGATRLYEKAGMHVDRQYTQYEKELRAGESLMTETLD